MKDERGFEIPCKEEQWEIINDREDKDFICRGDGNYGWFCPYSDKEKCRYYVKESTNEKGI